MKACTLIAGIALLSGCASLSDREREERAYEAEENRAQFFQYRQRCHNSGGFVVVVGSHGRLGSSGVPANSEYRCQKSLSFR